YVNLTNILFIFLKFLIHIKINELNLLLRKPSFQLTFLNNLYFQWIKYILLFLL
ncbi:MAG: hypothetical protein RL368_1562, partial [Pseudomonadota bacterium]